MRVLFIDQAYHLTTRSANFFLEILKSAFEVDTHYYSQAYQANIPQNKIDWADVIIIWETTLGRKNFVVPNKPCIYIPMYDGDWGSCAQWRRIANSGCKIISFCNEITKMAKRGKVPHENILELRYAYNPDDFTDYSGDPSIAALWERGFFGIKEFKKLFSPGFFKKVLLFRRPQPGLTYEEISTQDITDYNIEIDDSQFMPKEEYLKTLKTPGVYVAPRPKEGIGMSFLEQLAMGKCVIVHDDGSMNEYVKNGENGVIRDFYNITEPISQKEIDIARKNVKSYSVLQYQRWLSDKEKIIPFITNTAKMPPVKISGVVDLFWRTFYLVEAALKRI